MSEPVYELVVDSDSYATLAVVHDADLDQFIDGFEGVSMAADWNSPPVRVVRNGSREAELPDFASLFGAVPIVSQRAVDAFGGALEQHGELLPLECDEGSFWALNVLSTVDLLDEARSEGDWFAPGRLMTLKRLVPRHPAAVEIPLIFKLPQWRKGRALLTVDFIEAVRQRSLRGLNPRKIGQV